MTRKGILLILVVTATVLAQTKPPSYKLDGGTAEWLIRDTSPQDVWTALTKSLEVMKWKVMNKTADGLIINVMANLPNESDPMKKPKAFIGVASEFTDVMVSGVWYVGQKGNAQSPQEEAKKFWDELFSRMVEALK